MDGFVHQKVVTRTRTNQLNVVHECDLGELPAGAEAEAVHSSALIIGATSQAGPRNPRLVDNGRDVVSSVAVVGHNKHNISRARKCDLFSLAGNSTWSLQHTRDRDRDVCGGMGGFAGVTSEHKNTRRCYRQNLYFSLHGGDPGKPLSLNK